MVNLRKFLASFIIFALLLTSAQSGFAQVADIGKEAQSYIKQLVKEQQSLKKRALSITAHIAKTKFPMLEGEEQRALWAHEEMLNNEQVVIEKILAFKGYTPGSPNSFYSWGNLAVYGRSLARSLPAYIRSAVAEHKKTVDRQQEEKRRGASEKELAFMQVEMEERLKALEVASRIPATAARYLASIGAQSLPEYKAQVDAIDARYRAQGERGPSAEEAGSVVLGFLLLGLVASAGAPPPTATDRTGARAICDILGGRLTGETSSELGTCR